MDLARHAGYPGRRSSNIGPLSMAWEQQSRQGWSGTASVLEQLQLGCIKLLALGSEDAPDEQIDLLFGQLDLLSLPLILDVEMWDLSLSFWAMSTWSLTKIDLGRWS
jgi:hypothetical protein